MTRSPHFASDLAARRAVAIGTDVDPLVAHLAERRVDRAVSAVGPVGQAPRHAPAVAAVVDPVIADFVAGDDAVAAAPRAARFRGVEALERQPIVRIRQVPLGLEDGHLVDAPVDQAGVDAAVASRVILPVSAECTPPKSTARCPLM